MENRATPPGAPAEDAHTQIISQSPATQGYNGSPGCLFLIILSVVLYVLHGLLILAQASIYEAKWHEKASPNYTITATEIRLGGLSGKLRVRNGKVVDTQPPIFSEDRYHWITVDGIFEQIRSHAFSPFGFELVDYDSDYGYPKKVRFNQWGLATDQPIGIDVDYLSFDPNP